MNKKVLKSMLAFIVIIAIVVSFLFLNEYWKEEKLFIHKTGYNKKAILNSTWNMSSKEVERANKLKLKKGLTFVFFEPGLNKLLNEKRITAKKIDDFNLWTFTSELTYDFFDDRLFRYSFIGELAEPNSFDSIAVNNLKNRYGKMIKDTNQFGGNFLKDSVSVEYSQFNIENSKNETEHRFLIKVTYLPIFNEIVRESENEQNSILN
ncbi:hypothetical protein [Pedobacter sp. JCM 36344]|uniref:hypothetical protein n=1 Tax=Pedobacter sp. JCM 36344 TaxID=3374280 RepID=UPI003979ACF9